MNQAERQSEVLSFDTTIHGTKLHAEVEISPRGTQYLTEAQMDATRALLTHLANVAAEYQPEEDTRDESLDAYVVLADTFQVLDLARAAVDSRPKEAMRYFWHAASNLEVLQAWDPRFTQAYLVARYGEELAGNFVLEPLEELCEQIESWMPQRYAGPGFTQRRVVVDDRQSAEDFQRTLTPDHEAVSVLMVDDEDLPADEYQLTGRTVLPVPMFPDGTLDTRAMVRRIMDDQFVTCKFHTDRPAFHLLRTLTSAAQLQLVEHRGSTPVEFYSHLAHAKQLCRLARQDRFLADGVYRRTVIGALYSSLITVSLFSDEWVMPKYLAKLAATLNEDLGSDDVIYTVHAIEAWLPRDIRELMPRVWNEKLDTQLQEPLVAGLNVLPGARFVAVLDEQTQADFEETGLPDVDKFSPIDLGPELGEDALEVLSIPNISVFRTWV